MFTLLPLKFCISCWCKNKHALWCYLEFFYNTLFLSLFSVESCWFSSKFQLDLIGWLVKTAIDFFCMNKLWKIAINFLLVQLVNRSAWKFLPNYLVDCGNCNQLLFILSLSLSFSAFPFILWGLLRLWSFFYSILSYLWSRSPRIL